MRHSRSTFLCGFIVGAGAVLSGLILGAMTEPEAPVTDTVTAAEAEFGSVKARQILLVDKDGQPQVSLVGARFGGGVVISGVNNKPLVTLGGYPNGGLLVIYTKDGKPAVVLSSADTGGKIETLNLNNITSGQLP